MTARACPTDTTSWRTIVGPSGSGKTTLCNLMARFWDVQSDSVCLGGRDVREYSYDSLIRNFSFVFQRTYLFSDTIANNIRFGKPDASMEEVQAAAKKARCYDFIMALPEGFDTVIGEAGSSPFRRRAPAHFHRPGDYEGRTHHHSGRSHSQC